MKNVDVEKIIALRRAGWNTQEIAAEMHMETDAVDKVIAEYVEREKKKTEAKSRGGSGEKEVSYISITRTQLNEIYERAATIGAREALKTFEQERKKEHSRRSDRRLRNTKRLDDMYEGLRRKHGILSEERDTD